MSEEQNSGTGEAAEAEAPTQAQLYDDLRRIGQLEDQKFAIQQEIDERTERLRNAIPHLDSSSLLHKMLVSTLAPAKKATPAKKTPAKKTSKKKVPSKKSK